MSQAEVKFPYGGPPQVLFDQVSPWKHWVEYWLSKEDHVIVRGEVISIANGLVEGKHGGFAIDEDGELLLEINLSDTFAPCCAHFEPVGPWDVPTLSLAAQMFGPSGVDVWFQMRNPNWKIAYKHIEERDSYKKALAELPPLLKEWDEALAKAGFIAPKEEESNELG